MRVEGQAGRVALVMTGFAASDLRRADWRERLAQILLFSAAADMMGTVIRKNSSSLI